MNGFRSWCRGALALLAGSTASLNAQAVRGTVQDAANQPVSGVVLSLLDSTDAVVVRALSDERGEFRMLAGRAGTLRVRAQRIGYIATMSPAFVAATGATVAQNIVLEGVKTQLAAVRVTSSSSCGKTDVREASLVAVWEQAHTSLAASLLTSGTRGLSTAS
jgi:hypothetical protein